MKKLIFKSFLSIIFLLIASIVLLSIKGIETNKFNKLITDKAVQTNKIKLKLDTIKFKINPKEFNLFLETQNPQVIFREVLIPVKNIKVYIDFLSLIKSKPKIQKTSLILEELNVEQLNKLSIMIKPSNFKSLLNNKIKEGNLISEIDIFLTDNGKLKNFIARGSLKNLRVELSKNLNFIDGKLDFFADKNDVLIKNIFGDLEDIKISEGDIKLNLENGLNLTSNFNSKLKINKNDLNKYEKFIKKFEFTSYIKKFKANLNNNFSINLDKTYKVKDYNYRISGNIENGYFDLPYLKNIDIIEGEIKSINVKNLQILTNFSPKDISFKGNGKYSFDDTEFLKVNFNNKIKKNIVNVILDFEYRNSLELSLINYKKPANAIANISLNFEKKKNNLIIKNFNYAEGSSVIEINKLIFNKNNLSSFNEIKVKTINNDFFVKNNQNIVIRGNKFDATNLAKFFTNQTDGNSFKKLNSNIEIDFKNIKVPMSESLQNFKLLGEIKKGKFVKISSKGDFGGNNFLDISMKKDNNSEKKYLEIYSDLTRPLLTEYNFFKGLSGGKLLFTSIIDGSISNSKLKIEDFKIVNAPGVIKLLSLADLGGLADLAEGEGLSFDVLEINMEKNNDFLKLNEILALGPSMSVLMDGYLDENGLTSLRGTLVPAKTLNKIISKIPVIGNIVIPKEVGEGLFGISFKMKGPKGKIKTTINPIRTLTPRFIQKIVDRKKIN